MMGFDNTRRLAAILAADVAGYTRLVEADTDATVMAWREVRDDIVIPAVEMHGGKIVKFTGDGFLVEFPTVRNAVECAICMQKELEETSLNFRMGINLGDIIDDGRDIHGEGINIASRIEALAEPGGICIAGAVYDAIRNRIKANYVDMGEHHVKHVSANVRVYRIYNEGPAPCADIGKGNGAQGGGYSLGSEPEGDRENEIPAVDQGQNKPTIAVMPFANMSADPEQEFFADGLTEDILTELSRRHELFVISRNSTFVYKGKAVNLRDVAEKLNARYMVEGSVRKAGNRVRVTVQLIDADNDSHIWAERYDRDLDDIFALQDEITASIVATLPGRIEASAQDQLSRKKPSSLAAYECLLAAKVLHHRSSYKDNREALKMVDRALEIDPDYAHARAWRGCILGQYWGAGWAPDPEATLAEAFGEMEKAVVLDENDADVHRLLAAAGILSNDLPRAMTHQKRALELNPNYDLVVVQMGELLTWMGRPEEGMEWIKKAMALNPHFPPRFWSHLGKAYFAARQYPEALDKFLNLTTMTVDQRAFTAATYAWLGDLDKAGEHAAKIRNADPKFSIDAYLATTHYENEEDRIHLRTGLEKAGLEKAGL